jgi:hypothetical protein
MATMFAFSHMAKLDQEKHILWYEAVRTEVFLSVWIFSAMGGMFTILCFNEFLRWDLKTLMRRNGVSIIEH